MPVIKHVGLWLTVNLIVNAAKRDMQLSRPFFRAKKQAAATGFAKTAVGAAGGLVPAELVGFAVDGDLVLLKPDPGHITGTMSCPA